MKKKNRSFELMFYLDFIYKFVREENDEFDLKKHQYFTHI